MKLFYANFPCCYSSFFVQFVLLQVFLSFVLNNLNHRKIWLSCREFPTPLFTDDVKCLLYYLFFFASLFSGLVHSHRLSFVCYPNKVNFKLLVVLVCIWSAPNINHLLHLICDTLLSSFYYYFFFFLGFFCGNIMVIIIFCDGFFWLSEETFHSLILICYWDGSRSQLMVPLNQS